MRAVAVEWSVPSQKVSALSQRGAGSSFRDHHLEATTGGWQVILFLIGSVPKDLAEAGRASPYEGYF